ncbi:MAG: type I-E CRISPR-associated protein Cas5/CasD [Pseudomonadota bacterium]
MSASLDRRWLVLRFEAPLLSFGAVAIDNYGVTWDFPALSMLTGLFANALGYERAEREAHQALQDRMIFGSRREDEPYHGVLTDVQNVHMQKSDKGWTTRGVPEGRNGDSYGGPHRRFRDYHPDALVAVVLTLRPPPETHLPGGRDHPVLETLAAALDRPARPLFIGRKPCLPATPINAGYVDAATAHDALSQLQALADLGSQHCRKTGELRAQWPAGEGPDHGAAVERGVAIHDRRNWLSGLHGGTRRVIEGRVSPPVPRKPNKGEVTP